ncbi:MAG: hypothetical protein FVQ83_15570 [Chloroflexi bacterium]|nr:hypothetical protein [Chloroflexota bacterium]
MNRLQITLIILFLFTACTPAPTTQPPESSPTPTFIPTSTSTSTPTSLPTTTSTPTITPYPPLSPQGPYLMYQEYGNLIILDADGSGRRVIDLPEGGGFRNFQKSISPDGLWAALILGSPSRSPFWSLNLLFIPDGSIQLITPLLSEDYATSPRYMQTSIPWLNWSHDSRSLAFAGAMDGSLGNLFVYDLDTNQIRQLTDISERFETIDWSPDDDWIRFHTISQSQT